MNILLMIILLYLSQINDTSEKFDWISITQKPYAKLNIPDIGLNSIIEKGTNSINDWNVRKTSIEKKWRNQIGVLPEKPRELSTKFESTETLATHKRILLSFQSDENDRINAYLLLPLDIKKEIKKAAIVVFHQTTKDTIREPVGLGPNQQLAIANHLVERGYIVLAPECFIMKGKGPQGQAEALLKNNPNLTGMGKMTFDSIRCVDFLESIENVDPLRIGCIGFSLGAKEVLYAMAFESRYKAGVFNEGGIGIRMSNWTDPWYLTQKIKPNIPEMEHHQVLSLIAPRPILIMGGDSADGDRSWTFVKSVLPVYQLFGAEEKIGLINHHGKHAFPYSARSIAYHWLDHWLGHRPAKNESGPK
jgi:dienelactone hydrolase